MFEQPQYNPPDFSNALKALAISGAVFLVGCGLCGMDAYVHPNAGFGGGSEFGGGFLAVIGLILLLLSVLVAAGALLTLIVQAVTRFSRR